MRLTISKELIQNYPLMNWPMLSVEEDGLRQLKRKKPLPCLLQNHMWIQYVKVMPAEWMVFPESHIA
jgi:hypothetical protein